MALCLFTKAGSLMFLIIFTVIECQDRCVQLKQCDALSWLNTTETGVDVEKIKKRISCGGDRVKCPIVISENETEAVLEKDSDCTDEGATTTCSTDTG